MFVVGRNTLGMLHGERVDEASHPGPSHSTDDTYSPCDYQFANTTHGTTWSVRTHNLVSAQGHFEELRELYEDALVWTETSATTLNPKP